MAIHNGYDTDDLTDRQNHYFHVLNKGCSHGINAFALSFLSHCVKKNFSLNQFDNYDGDCDYLITHAESSTKLGVNLEEIYS